MRSLQMKIGELKITLFPGKSQDSTSDKFIAVSDNQYILRALVVGIDSVLFCLPC